MTRSQLILFLTTLLALYGVGQIWLVQLSSYRLWSFVGPREFEAYHWAWWRSIWGPVLAPAGVVFLGSVAMLWMRPTAVPGWAIWAGFVLEVLLALGTAMFWGPLMARLGDSEGHLILPLYRRLIATHWLRVGLVTSYGLLASWMLLKTLSPEL